MALSAMRLGRQHHVLLADAHAADGGCLPGVGGRAGNPGRGVELRHRDGPTDIRNVGRGGISSCVTG